MTTDPIAHTADWVVVKRNERRLGRVRLSEEALADEPKVAAALGEVVKSEHSWVWGCNELTCRGPMFDVVPEGADVPLYEVVMHTEDGELSRVEVRKCPA